MVAPRKQVELTHAELVDLVSYDPLTGIFRWRYYRFRCPPAGAVVGSLNARGYLRTLINKEFHFLHRLAWFYVHGVWPKDILDHANGVKTDNRIANLREADTRRNAYNRKRPRTNTSGVKGVQRYKNGGWGVWIRNPQRGNKMTLFGVYPDFDSAVKVRREKAAEWHGEFYNPGEITHA